MGTSDQRGQRVSDSLAQPGPALVEMVADPLLV
jgi:hypothetical protein